MSSPRLKRGRPESASTLTSAATNYQALAWQAKQLIDAAKNEGKKIKLIDAVRTVMRDSVTSRNADGIPTRENLVEVKLRTHYTEVRKILAAWKKEGIN